MWLFERNTARRGRSAVPRTFLRTRRCRRCRGSSEGFFFELIRTSLARLSGLALDVLAGVPDALALVRLGLADLANVGGHLADLLLVDAPHDDPGRDGHLELDAVGRRDA